MELDQEYDVHKAKHLSG